MDASTPPPSPYSLPWQLRPAIAATTVRADSAFASYEDTASNHGLTIAPTITASYRIPIQGKPGEGLTPLVRWALVNDSPPTGSGGFGLMNPLVGAAYLTPITDALHVGAFLGVTVPVGTGGGNSPDPAMAGVRARGQFARAQMDNALFAVNDLTPIPGVDLAWVQGGLTVQVEATFLLLTRVRGSEVQHEAFKVNFTSGAHVGYFIVPALSLGADVHYQRWIDPPFNVAADPTGTLDDNWTFAVGPRMHFHVDGVWLRPGVAYERGIDKPMAAAAPNYNIVLVDLPVYF